MDKQSLSHTPTNTDINDTVRRAYDEAAQRLTPGVADVASHAHVLGYSAAEVRTIPADANLGLGCGNPTAIAALEPGQTVVDLGSGAGMDAFLAAEQVGAEGRVIGVDMSQAMLERARNIAQTREVTNVEFREGYIEALPIADNSVDAVISNCVINLSPDKPQVFLEAFRVLKPGGTLAVSDLVLSHRLPDAILELAEAYIACIASAALADDYLGAIASAGFSAIDVERQSAQPIVDAALNDPTLKDAFALLKDQDKSMITNFLWSYRIRARKP